MSIYLLDWFKFPTIGEVSFACSSTEYLWEVPVGVTSITAVCIGGGGGGHAGNNQKQGAGGGGGGLRWINYMPVVPGEILRVKAGLGGTGCPTSVLASSGRLIAWGRPGQDSYIASDNNASVPGRTGIGGTIIVRAQGGGQDFYVNDQIRIIPPGNPGAGGFVDERTAGNADADRTESVGRAGGTGSTLGSFTWGTIGGGNGGDGGGGGGVGGGQDGGGGGAGGWFGSGGRGGQATNDESLPPTDGTGGAGGGGMFGGGGGASASGGGGGTGVFWGVGPNGVNGYYFWNGATIVKVVQDVAPSKTVNQSGFGGQGGSFGKDGRATGAEVILDTNYAVSGSFFGDPLINTNYFNESEGNGGRGYSGSVDNEFSTPVVIPNGGEYGGGGGGAQTAGGDNDTPIAGDGGCGHVRILFVARSQNIIREYGFGRTTQVRNLNGGNVTVKFYDYNPNLTLTQNRTAGWPAWYQVGSGEYYNILVNWAVDVPGREALPPAVGIGTNPSNYPI